MFILKVNGTEEISIYILNVHFEIPTFFDWKNTILFDF